MTKNKQQYIYVARDYDCKSAQHTSFRKFAKLKKSKGQWYCRWNRQYALKDFKQIPKYLYNIKLKKGEQKRMPILVDKAEVVK